MEAPVSIRRGQPQEVIYPTLGKLYFRSAHSLSNNWNWFESRSNDRNIRTCQFGEKHISSYISLLDFVAIYDLITHAQMPSCPKFRLMTHLRKTIFEKTDFNAWLKTRYEPHSSSSAKPSKWRKPDYDYDADDRLIKLPVHYLYLGLWFHCHACILIHT